jgi:hypothetical protein
MATTQDGYSSWKPCKRVEWQVTHTLKAKDASINVGLLEGRLTTLENEAMLEEQDITSLSCFIKWSL